MPEITELLQAWNKGDHEAMEKLMPLVDKELKKIAHNYMRNERAGHILQTTALVNEALIKLIRENISWENRKQFYGFIAKRMRQVLVGYARRRPKAEYVDIDDDIKSDQKSRELIRLDEALKALAELEERKATVVECRFFIGLTIPETAELLGVGTSTVERDWDFSRVWLHQQMTGELDEAGS
jgi:RNA polymerase sigma-70 factor, ECF subfamily